MKNFKKVLALVLVLATLMGLATVASAAYKDEKDISADYSEAIKVLNLIETMQGYPNGEFRPTATITREEAAKLIAIFDNKDTDISTYYTSINPFADEKGRWGESYVGYGYRAGIIAGMNANTFAPTANVTGTQFLKMALVTLGYDQEAEGFVGSSWAVNVLALAKKLGLVANLADGWKPEAALTRQEAAQILLDTLQADTVEYAQEAKSKDWSPNYDEEKDQFTFKGKLYLTVAGAVKTGNALYNDFNLKKEDSTDAFYRPYTKWTYDNKSVETMKAPKATFTTKFNACDLLVALGIKTTDTKTKVVIDHVWTNGDDDPLGDSMLLGTLKHTVSGCDMEDLVHGAQGTLTQVFYNGTKDKDGTKHYDVVSIDTWLAKVETVTKKVTARDDHLRSKGAVTLTPYVFGSEGDDTTNTDNNDAYCSEDVLDRADDMIERYNFRCGSLLDFEGATLSYSDPEGLSKGDYVLFTYSFRQRTDPDEDGNTEYYDDNGVQSVDLATAKDGRYNGYRNGNVANDPTETRIDGEFVKDSQHFHLNYTDSKTADNYGTYTFFYDAYGNVIGMTDSKDTSAWSVIDRAWMTYENEGTDTLNMKVVGLDAKAVNGTLKKINGIDELTDDDLAHVFGMMMNYEEYTGGLSYKDFELVYDHLFKITTGTDNKFTVEVVDLEDKTDDGDEIGAYLGVHPYFTEDGDLAKYTIKVDNKKPYLTVVENGGAEDTDITLTADTKFLIHKMDGTYASYTGYKNVPSLIAHYAEVVYVEGKEGKQVADVVYLANEVYMTDGKVTAYVGNNAVNDVRELEDGNTYYGLEVFINGESSIAYVTEADRDANFGTSFNKGFYQLQYTSVDKITTVKVLKSLDEFDNYLKKDPKAAVTLDKTSIKLEGVKSISFADDCAMYFIDIDPKTEVGKVEKADIDTMIEYFENNESNEHKFYVELNKDGEAVAVYMILAEND